MSDNNAGMGLTVGPLFGVAALGFVVGKLAGGETASTPAVGAGVVDVATLAVGPDVYLGDTPPVDPAVGSVWLTTETIPGANKVYKNPYADQAGGTVHTTALNASAKGFTLLTTAPLGAGYVGAGHASSAWDEENLQMFIFGADTHGSDFCNSVFAFSCADGKVRRSYAPDDKSSYSCSPSGLLTAGAASNRPWGAHAFPGTIRFDSTTREIEFGFDVQQHAYLDSVITAAGVAVGSHQAPFWYYNVDTGNWRVVNTPAISTFIKGISTGTGIIRVPGEGWYSIYAPWVRHLSEDGTVYSAVNTPNVNPNIQSFDHEFFGGAKRVVVSFGGTNGGGAADPFPQIGAVQDLANPANNRVLLAADYPILTGWNPRNMWSVKISDTKIAFAAQNAAGVVGVFVYDYVANTMTDSGDRLAASADHVSYELKAEWSTTLGAAIIVADRAGSPHKFYMWRPA